ncbi:hypothetical protein FGO68_gene4744 [Halteria grandinella]|uniref:Uncharacterized protein n=1 Tax=Halteria grandinella TaxID=5974 RepID=A0A8J8NKR8_HALGN|nr:hypothetical protein FGO68_gene4744 [Halteria grandinella]
MQPVKLELDLSQIVKRTIPVEEVVLCGFQSLEGPVDRAEILSGEFSSIDGDEIDQQSQHLFNIENCEYEGLTYKEQKNRQFQKNEFLHAMGHKQGDSDVIQQFQASNPAQWLNQSYNHNTVQSTINKDKVQNNDAHRNEGCEETKFTRNAQEYIIQTSSNQMESKRKCLQFDQLPYFHNMNLRLTNMELVHQDIQVEPPSDQWRQITGNQSQPISIGINVSRGLNYQQQQEANLGEDQEADEVQIPDERSP